MGLGGFWWSSVLDSVLPSQSLRLDTQPEHQDPAIHTAQKKRKKENLINRQNPRTNGKSKTEQANSHKETYMHTLTKREKGKKKERE